MIALADPTQTYVRRCLPMQDGLAQQGALAPNGWGRMISNSLAPYKLSFTAGQAGLMLEGDQLAVEIGAEILETLLGQKVLPSEISITEAVRRTIDYHLQHALTFRLTGVAHPLRPLSLSQFAFMNALLHAQEPLVLGVGPAGTGKTHLAIAAGINALATGKVKKLVASRPHVIMEGEEITASMRAETSNDAQLQPIEDELRQLLGHAELKRLKEQDLIEVVPLGLMRGRTFGDAFIVIDEAQNMTVRKMRMVVTRLGRGARMVITGDPTQIELHEDEPSGLPHLLQLLAGKDLAYIHEFKDPHVTRDSIAARLEALYQSAGSTRMRVA